MKRVWRLVRNQRLASVAQLTGFRALVLAANTATGMLSARMLGPQGRGVQTGMIVGPQTIIGIFSLGLHTSVVFNTKADPQHERELFGSALLIAFVSGTLGMAAGWLCIPILLGKYDPSIVLNAQLLLLIVPVSVISYVFVSILESHGQFAVVSRISFAGCIFTLVSLMVLWFAQILTPPAAAAAYLLPAIPMCLLLWLRAREICRPVFPFNMIYLRRMLFYTLRYFGVDLFATVGTYLDQLILVLFLMPHDVGNYAVAISAARVLSIIPMSIYSVLFPAVAGRSQESIMLIVGIAFRVSCILTAMAGFALAILAPFILALLYGDKFEEAILPFRILLVSTAINNLASIQYQVFSAAGRPAIVTLFEFTGMIISGISMLVLVPLFGTAGAALSLLVAAIAKLGFVFTGIFVVLKLPIPRLILNRADMRWILGRNKSDGYPDGANAPLETAVKR